MGPWRRLTLSLMGLSVILGGCETSETRQAGSGAAVSVEAGGGAPALHSKPMALASESLPECAASSVICPTVQAPVACTAATYEGKAWSEVERPIVWAANTCQGRVALSAEHCRRGLAPAKAGMVECVPDGSAGRCPPAQLPCAQGGKPASCTAQVYGDQNLPESARPHGHGADRCAAIHAMMIEVCRSRLDPSQVKGVVCQVDGEEGPVKAAKPAVPALKKAATPTKPTAKPK